MTRSMRRVIAGVILTSLMSGCLGQSTLTGGMTPAPSSRPAFLVELCRKPDVGMMSASWPGCGKWGIVPDQVPVSCSPHGRQRTAPILWEDR